MSSALWSVSALGSGLHIFVGKGCSPSSLCLSCKFARLGDGLLGAQFGRFNGGGATDRETHAALEAPTRRNPSASAPTPCPSHPAADLRAAGSLASPAARRPDRLLAAGATMLPGKKRTIDSARSSKLSLLFSPLLTTTSPSLIFTCRGTIRFAWFVCLRCQLLLWPAQVFVLPLLVVLLCLCSSLW